nr:MAG TPA: hypothetical protein [Caudoviricetes sp.]
MSRFLKTSRAMFFASSSPCMILPAVSNAFSVFLSKASTLFFADFSASVLATDFTLVSAPCLIGCLRTFIPQRFKSPSA